MPAADASPEQAEGARYGVSASRPTRWFGGSGDAPLSGSDTQKAPVLSARGCRSFVRERRADLSRDHRLHSTVADHAEERATLPAAMRPSGITAVSAPRMPQGCPRDAPEMPVVVRALDILRAAIAARVGWHPCGPLAAVRRRSGHARHLIMGPPGLSRNGTELTLIGLLPAPHAPGVC